MRSNCTKLGEISRKLAPYCRKRGIIKLEIFGGKAHCKSRSRRNVNLIATFRDNPGLSFFAMDEEIGEILGVPTLLLTRESVETMSNAYRRESILADTRIIYPFETIQEHSPSNPSS